LQAHLKATPTNAKPKLLKELAKSTQMKKKFLKNCPTTRQKKMKNAITNRLTNHSRQESTSYNN